MSRVGRYITSLGSRGVETIYRFGFGPEQPVRAFSRMIVEPVKNGAVMKTMGLTVWGLEPIILVGFGTAGKFEIS